MVVVRGTNIIDVNWIARPAVTRIVHRRWEESRCVKRVTVRSRLITLTLKSARRTDLDL